MIAKTQTLGLGGDVRACVSCECIRTYLRYTRVRRVCIVHSYMLGSEFLYNNMQNITILFCNISNPNFRAINLHKCTYHKTVLFSYFLQ